MILSQLLFTAACTALPSLHERLAYSPLSVRPVVQFPNPTWVENLYVRSNGRILATTLSNSSVLQINPLAPNETVEVAATFSNTLGIIGIEEIQPCVFRHCAGIYELSVMNMMLLRLRICLVCSTAECQCDTASRVSSVL